MELCGWNKRGILLNRSQISCTLARVPLSYLTHRARVNCAEWLATVAARIVIFQHSAMSIWLFAQTPALLSALGVEF